MGTYCAPLDAHVFLCRYERDFIMPLSDDKQADIIAALNTTSRYLDDILNKNNIYFDNMLRKIYYEELPLNKANASDTEVSFLTCICSFLMILLLKKLMKIVTIVTLILKLSISFFIW